MWKCPRLSMLKEKACNQTVKLFLLRHQSSDEDELARSNQEKNRAAYAKHIQMLIKKRENLQRMNLAIQRQQAENDIKIRLNKQQLAEATDEWNKMNKDKESS